MPKRRSFDASAIDGEFWRRGEVRRALTVRDIGSLLREFLAAYPGCTQIQLALLIEHDRSEVSNWVRGARRGTVSDIDVLGRIAYGLRMPDTARVMMGLAPAEARLSDFGASSGPERPASAIPGELVDPVDVAVCGSRKSDTDAVAIDAVIPGLARAIVRGRWRMHHGPVGVGIEIMTYIADRYRRPSTGAAIGTFGHHHVVAPAAVVLVIGGGAGTGIEIDLAVTMGKKILPFAASGGVAEHFAMEAADDPSMRGRISEATFLALCRSDADTYPLLVGQLIGAEEGVNS